MWQISKSYDWQYLEDAFSWIRDMNGVPQDPRYHAEGDVAIHTRMVLDVLQQLEEFQLLNEQEQHILCAAALLHDVEKRSTTVIEEDGSITSKGHAKKGEYTATQILYTEVETPFEIRLEISKLVRHHGLPLWVFEKENPLKEVLKASTFLNTKLLGILAKADVLGRICTDAEELLYRIELFNELCKEHQCFGEKYPFVDEYSRYNYLAKDNISPAYKIYNESSFEVIMLAALPGAGKDTYYQQQLADWSVVSLDAIRREMKIAPTDKRGNGKVIQAAKEQAKRYMRAKENFVWNATNITRQLRSQLIDLFLSYGAYVRLLYIEVPYKTLSTQNQNREYVVPSKVIEKMISKLEVPTVDEAHIVEYIVK